MPRPHSARASSTPQAAPARPRAAADIQAPYPHSAAAADGRTSILRRRQHPSRRRRSAMGRHDGTSASLRRMNTARGRPPDKTSVRSCETCHCSIRAAEQVHAPRLSEPHWTDSLLKFVAPTFFQVLNPHAFLTAERWGLPVADSVDRRHHDFDMRSESSVPIPANKERKSRADVATGLSSSVRHFAMTCVIDFEVQVNGRAASFHLPY